MANIKDTARNQLLVSGNVRPTMTPFIRRTDAKTSLAQAIAARRKELGLVKVTRK